MNHDARSGAFFAIAAYGSWGLVPLYWKALGPVPSLELLAHRVVWSLVFVAAAVAILGKLGETREALRSWRVAARLLLTTALISANWGIFIWAVQSGRLLEASLGYYINPLANVALGVVALGERLRRTQVIAVGLALCGVVVMTAAAGVFPWVSLLLAGSFALYGLLRKTAPVDALTGLFIETGMLLPVAGGYVAWLEARGQGALGQGTAGHGAMLAAAGLVTALPLLWFTAAARRLPLSTLGFFQYIAPTCQFLLAVFLYDEPLSAARTTSFALIWAALLLLTVEARLKARG